MSRQRMRMHAAAMNEGARDSWWQVSLSDTHCGAGCALGDIGGEWIVWATGWMIGSTAALGPEYILDLPLAWTFGILFQYFVIAPLRGQVGQLAPLGDAIKSDTLSVLSFEVGLFGWMAVAHYLIWKPPLPIDSSSQWFQAGSRILQTVSIGSLRPCRSSQRLTGQLVTKPIIIPICSMARG